MQNEEEETKQNLCKHKSKTHEKGKKFAFCRKLVRPPLVGIVRGMMLYFLLDFHLDLLMIQISVFSFSSSTPQALLVALLAYSVCSRELITEAKGNRRRKAPKAHSQLPRQSKHELEFPNALCPHTTLTQLTAQHSLPT